MFHIDKQPSIIRNNENKSLLRYGVREAQGINNNVFLRNHNADLLGSEPHPTKKAENET